jgi:hypothetical protein
VVAWRGELFRFVHFTADQVYDLLPQYSLITVLTDYRLQNGPKRGARSYRRSSPKGCDRCRRVPRGADREAACVLESILNRV